MLLWWPNGRGTPPELEPQQHLLRKTSHSLATATFCNTSTLSAPRSALDMLARRLRPLHGTQKPPNLGDTDP